MNLLGLTNAGAVLDDSVELSGGVLGPVVVVVEVVHIVHVVVVDVSPFQGLGAAEVLLAAESVLVNSWLVSLAVGWHLRWRAAKWADDLGSASWNITLSGVNLSSSELLSLQVLKSLAESGVGSLTGSNFLLSSLEFSLVDGLSNSLLLHLLLNGCSEKLFLELFFLELLKLLLGNLLLQVLNLGRSDASGLGLHWLLPCADPLCGSDVRAHVLGQLLLNKGLFIEGSDCVANIAWSSTNIERRELVDDWLLGEGADRLLGVG